MGSFDQKAVIGPPQWDVGAIQQFAGIPIASSTLPSGPPNGLPAVVAGFPDPYWLRCDGSIISRLQYPKLSAAFGGVNGVGTFTPTSRSFSTVPNSSALAVNGSNIVAPGVAGTSGVQYSSNAGVTWATATTPSYFGVATNGLINAGSSFFALGSAANTGAYSPSATGSGTWTASTGIPFSPTTCGTNGAGTIILPTGTIYNLSTNSGASFASATCATAVTGAAIVWTGSQFIMFCASSVTGVGYQTSPTGLTSTWTAAFSAPWGVLPIASACSDGNGNVLAIVNGSSIAWISNTNGTTWRSTLLPSNSLGSCSYTNGRWFVPLENTVASAFYSDGSIAVSSDLQSWIFVPIFSQPSVAANTAVPTQVGYSGGNYISISQLASGTLTTIVENTSQMYLPISRRSSMISNIQTNSIANYQEWIRAA